MKILLDTSILVAAMVEAHPAHEQGVHWLKRVTNGADEGFVSAHSLAEMYSVLTTLPVQPHISPDEAQRLIQHNVLHKLKVITLSGEDYAQLIGMLAEIGIVGGATFDALILHAAAKEDVDIVVTLNEKDFRRVYPDLAGKIIAP